MLIGYSGQEEGSARNAAFGGPNVHYSGSSLDFLRSRRLISPFAAVTKKPAVLSPSSLSDSMSSITSWGIRTVVICDFAFFAPVAITDTPWIKCMSVYAKKIFKKGLRCISPWSSLFSEGEIHLVQCEAHPDGRPGWASNQNVTKDYIMACSHDTQTRPEKKYHCCFLVLRQTGFLANFCCLIVEVSSGFDAGTASMQFYAFSSTGRVRIQEVANV